MLNLNVPPYFDDFNEDKNYHKILFKPGVSVQSRELTQIQTILQNQIKNFGNFVLAEGAKISGAKTSVDSNIRVISLQNTGSISSDILNFQSLYVVGVTSSVIGLIVDIDYSNYKLFVKLQNASTDNFTSGESLAVFKSQESAHLYTINNTLASDFIATVNSDTLFSINDCTGTQYSDTIYLNTLTLQVGDALSSASLDDTYYVSEIIDGASCIVHKPLGISFTAIALNVTRYASVVSLEANVEEGIFYSNGYFIKNLAQFIVPDPRTLYPSAVIGFTISENIATYIDDPSLLDPALGSSNYSAPGADRYVIELNIVSKPLVGDSVQNLTSDKFIELMRIKRGKIISQINDTSLGELENILAKRMYDHAGNFIVNPFTIDIQSKKFSDSSSSFPVQISTGKAYVNGHKFELNYPANMMLENARDTAAATSINIPTYYGNSLDLVLAANSGSVNLQTNPSVEIHSANAFATTFNTKIGTAKVRNFSYVSGNTYTYFLYDVALTGTSANIASAKSIIAPTTANVYSSYTFAANTALAGVNVKLTDTAYNSLIYPLQHTPVANVSLVQFQATKLTSASSFAANTTTIYSDNLSSIIQGSGIGTVSAAAKKQYFYVVAKSTAGSYASGSPIKTDDLTITIGTTGSQYYATLSMANPATKWYNGPADIFYTVQYTSASPKVKTLNTNAVANVYISATNTEYDLGYSDICNVSYVYYLPFNSGNTSYIYTGTWNNSTTYQVNNCVLYNNILYSATISTTGVNPSGNTTQWAIKSPINYGYAIDSGQTDSYYDHGTISVRDYTRLGTYIVIFDYFTHGSGGYLSLQSYPGSIPYSKIPIYISPKNVSYNLRDCLDFRPRRQDLSSTVAFDYFEIPAPASTAVVNYTYYLSRIDCLVLDPIKQLVVIKGTSSYKNPIPPQIPPNTMSLATIFYSAYGFTLDDVQIVYSSHKRYTMDDIGKLDKRLDRVEYYTSLSIAESDLLNKTKNDSLLSQQLASGFLVDGFTGFTVADISHPEYKATIDPAENCCRARTSRSTGHIYPTNILAPNITYTSKGILHFPYISNTDECIIGSNKLFTGNVALNPFNVTSYYGILELSPDKDIAFDTGTTPAINAVTEDLKALSIAKVPTAVQYSHTDARTGYVDRGTIAYNPHNWFNQAELNAQTGGGIRW